MAVDEFVLTRKRVQIGEHLFRAGDPFDSLYTFRSGFFKSYVVAEDGRTQVTGFPMAGDCVGMDGIGSETHTQNVMALATGEVCVMPYAPLQKPSGRSPGLQRQVNRIMSHEIVREQQIMVLLGTMQGEARVADFLLSLSTRFAARGHSSTEFNLCMSRAEIGSYLGLRLQTVSRIISTLQRLGLVRAKGREVGIMDLPGLRAIARDEKKALQRGARHSGQPAFGLRFRRQAGSAASSRPLQG
jgi:CRP/FNR family transcriptional regulator